MDLNLTLMRDLVYEDESMGTFRTHAALDARALALGEVVVTADTKQELHTALEAASSTDEPLHRLYLDGTYYLVALPDGVRLSLARHCVEAETDPANVVDIVRAVE